MLLTTIEAVRSWRRAAHDPVGLVPTMGFLHEAHLSLVRRAREQNSRVVATVFVNPTQFGASEDLETYPRNFRRDLALLEEVGCDVVFAPAPEEMYPRGFQTWVEVSEVARSHEGARRPGHFRGVATVVLKLFGIVEPIRAYFGEKDAQQLAVIRRMARDLDSPVEIVGCPTVREPDGLAMSSRNAYLSPVERIAAPVLFRSLCAARDRWLTGERRAAALKSEMLGILDTEPLAGVEYVSLADPDTFEELVEARPPALLSLAVRVGRARLIDNLRLVEPGAHRGTEG